MKRFSANLIAVVLLYTRALADSSEEHHFDNGIYSPPAVNFNEIFTNSLSMLNDEGLTSVGKDEEFHLNSLPAQFAEFQSSVSTTTSTTTKSTPRPRYLTAAYMKKEITTPTIDETSPISISTMSTTTERHKEAVMKLLPQKKERGVLDLLFPASRVRGFKNVFETFRRLMSSTFR